jgi:hypothetical protein
VLNRTTEHPSEQIPWTDGQGNTSINTMAHGDAIIQLQHKYTALRSDFMLLVEKLHEFGAVLLSCCPMPSDLPESRNAPAPNSPMMVEPQTLSAQTSPEIRYNSNPVSFGMDAASSSKPSNASMLANHSVLQDKGNPNVSRTPDVSNIYLDTEMPDLNDNEDETNTLESAYPQAGLDEQNQPGVEILEESNGKTSTSGSIALAHGNCDKQKGKAGTLSQRPRGRPRRRSLKARSENTRSKPQGESS